MLSLPAPAAALISSQVCGNHSLVKTFVKEELSYQSEPLFNYSQCLLWLLVFRVKAKTDKRQTNKNTRRKEISSVQIFKLRSTLPHLPLIKPTLFSLGSHQFSQIPNLAYSR
jgi:hypothetical protein